MLKVQSQLITQDNSGVKRIQCIKSFQGTTVRLGNPFLISIKEMKSRLNLKKKTKLKKGQVNLALLTQTRYKNKTKIGYLWFDKNKAILLDKKQQPIGNRLIGSVPYFLRKKGFLKVLTMSSNILG